MMIFRCFSYAVVLCFAQLSMAQVGVGTVTPNAAFDVVSTNSGFLIPRVQLTALAVAAPVTNPQTGALVNGTLVYNLGPAAPGNLAAGFYYWNTNTWVAIAGAPAASNAWLTTGNSGTVPATNFVGTIDNVDFRVRTNNSERFTFSNNGRFRAHTDGDAAQPTYSWSYASNGTNMGMYRAGAGILGFSTAGAERMRIDVAGNVAINKATDANDRLSVGTTTALQSAIGAYSNANTIFATSSHPLAAGVLARNSSGSGAGIIGSATGSTNFSGGSGGSFTGFGYGAVGLGVGTGVGGVGNGNLTTATHPDNAGVAGRGMVGVYGATIDAINGWAGYFAGDIYADYMLANDYFITSDERLKTNVVPVNQATNTIAQLRPYHYTKTMHTYEKQQDIDKTETRIVKNTVTGTEYGFLAQDIEKLLPDLVKTKNLTGNTEDTAIKSVNYIGLIPVMVKAMQEQQQVIENQEARIARLEALLEKIITD